MQFQLQDFLGKDNEDQSFLAFLAQLPSQPEFSDCEGSAIGGYLRANDLGFEIALNGKGLINTIFLYSGFKDGFSECPFALPKGLSFDQQRRECLTALGPPKLSGGPMADFLTKQPIRWDRWDYEGWALHLEFSMETEQIRMVTLMDITDGG